MMMTLKLVVLKLKLKAEAVIFLKRIVKLRKCSSFLLFLLFHFSSSKNKH